jgi:putative methionine-R-sulfoxide reductase with GAF domain
LSALLYFGSARTKARLGASRLSLVAACVEPRRQNDARSRLPTSNDFRDTSACDPRSKSEVVVPVLDRAGSLIAVFDVDSTRRAAFDQQDVAGLEQMVRWFAGEGRG